MLSPFFSEIGQYNGFDTPFFGALVNLVDAGVDFGICVGMCHTKSTLDLLPKDFG